MKPSVYIAGPYSIGDVCLNIRKAVRVADFAIKLGYIPYLPHTTHLWHIISPHPIEFWYEYDLYWLRKCSELWKIPGDSFGVDLEEKEARRLGIKTLLVLGTDSVEVEVCLIESL